MAKGQLNSSHLVSLVQAGVKFPDGQTRILPSLSSNFAVNPPMDANLEKGQVNNLRYGGQRRVTQVANLEKGQGIIAGIPKR